MGIRWLRLKIWLYKRGLILTYTHNEYRYHTCRRFHLGHRLPIPIGIGRVMMTSVNYVGDSIEKEQKKDDEAKTLEELWR